MKAISPRIKSFFTHDALKGQFKDGEFQKLAAEYEEAAAEIQMVNQDLEGILSDGLF